MARSRRLGCHNKHDLMNWQDNDKRIAKCNLYDFKKCKCMGGGGGVGRAGRERGGV